MTSGWQISGLQNLQSCRVHKYHACIDSGGAVQPTNDLDIATVEQLEQILQAWQGCIIVASHDRALLDAIAPRLLVLPGDGHVQLYDGRYSQVRTPAHLM